jgi:hypothetical protein
MKSKQTSSFVIALSLLVALMTLPAATQAQPKLRFRTDTGVFILGPNQILRLSIVFDDQDGDGFVGKGGATAFRFGKAVYMSAGCNNEGVCKKSIASQSLSAPMTLNPGEAATFDINDSGSPVRGLVLSNRSDVRVNAAVVDLETGKITGIAVFRVSGDGVLN